MVPPLLAFLSRKACTFFAATCLLWVSPLVAERTLTKAAEVRGLSFDEAETGLTARLRGIVVLVEPGGVIIQDETSTTYFRPGPGESLRVGDVVEIEGKTRNGRFLPGLGTSVYRIVGRGTIPPGTPVNYDDLVSGHYHYQLISVEGVVRSVELYEDGRSLIKLTVGSRLLEARVETEPEQGNQLVDARVRITGVAAGLINERRQLVKPYVWVSDWSRVAVLKPAPALEDVPLVSASDLLIFREAGMGKHRVRLKAIVTASFAKGEAYLRQGDDAFSARFRSPASLSPGDRIELVGFPDMDRYSASIVDADLIDRTFGPSPIPLAIGSLKDLGGIHDAHLVTVTAVVLDAFKMASGITVRLQSQETSVEARLPEGAFIPEPQSKIRLTAICVVESARRGSSAVTSTADVLSLRARRPEDLHILQNPSWWTARRLAITLAVVGSITALTILWTALLRRQVRQQTKALREGIEIAAAFEERQRIAREFHDSLQQDLTGLGLRLDAVATRALDDKAKRIIQISRGLLTRIQVETRNFVSDLRDTAADVGDLAKALESIVDTQQVENVELRLEFSAQPPALPAGIVHHLRLMVRESVANAIRHARPKIVRIQVSVEATLTIRITDDGVGFDAVQETHGRSGHFGCVGLRERAQKIGADIRWRSAPGVGTTVEIVLGGAAQLADTYDTARPSASLP